MTTEEQEKIEFGQLADFQGLPSSAFKAFDCGEGFLNEFLKNQVRQRDAKSLTKTSVCVANGTTIAGYVSVQVHSFEKKDMGSTGTGMPNDVPVLMVGQIATDKKFQGNGIGKKLLARAFKAALAIRELAGITGVVLWAHPDAISFYEERGMTKLTTRKSNGLELTLMHLPIEFLVDAVN